MRTNLLNGRSLVGLLNQLTRINYTLGDASGGRYDQ